MINVKAVTILSAPSGISNWNWDLGNTTSTAAPSFTHLYNIAGNYTITLITTTAAGCSSAPAAQTITIGTTPVVNAGTDTAIRVGNSVTLNASFSPAGNYTYTWSPSVYLNAVSILNPVSTPGETTNYTLLAVDNLGNCAASDEVIITVVSALYIPSAFTPNNDGKNDKWVIPGLAFYPEARVLVFNRAGQMICDTKGYSSNPWDGRFRGVIQPNDVYVYLIHLNDDQKQVLKGTVTISR